MKTSGSIPSWAEAPCGIWGVYPNSLAIVLAGMGCPVEVWATQEIGETGVDMATMAHLRFRNGAVAQICSSFRFLATGVWSSSVPGAVFTWVNPPSHPISRNKRHS